MFRVSGVFSRWMAFGACAALISGSTVAAPQAKPSGPKTVPITIPLSYVADTPIGWRPAHERYEARRNWKRHRHNDGIDGGDVLVGLLVLGGVVAVAGAIDKSGNDQRDRRRAGDYPQPTYDYRGGEPRADDWRRPQRSSSRGMDRAVEACAAEAAREGPVDEIYEVDRIDGEWRIRGDFRNGGAFTCNIDANGRARVGTGDRAQLGDWNAQGGDDVSEGSEPGAKVGADGDDRYATGEAPDFEDPRGR